MLRQVGTLPGTETSVREAVPIRAVPIRVPICVCVLLACVSLQAADFQTGMDAYRAGDFETAFREWSPLAEQGSAIAQFNLGLMFEQGKGRPVDLAVAAEWYLRAADGGFARAQFAIAEMYEAGRGLERDVVEAYKWFKLAAEQRYEGARKRRKKLADTMTSTEIALGEMWAREWKRVQKASGTEEPAR